MSPTKKTAGCAVLPLVFTILSAVLLSAIQFYIMHSYYETDIHLYKANMPLTTIFNILLVLLGVISVVLFGLNKKVNDRTALPDINFTASFFGAMTAFLLFSLTLFGVLDYVQQPKPFAIPVLFDSIRLIFAIPAGIYFIIVASEKKTKRINHAVFGFFAVLWAAMHLMTLYFDMTTPLNSPPRVLCQLAFVAVMLFLLYELRFPMGMAQTSRYLMAAVVTVLIMAPSVVASAYIIYLGVFPLSSDTIGTAIQFTLLGYTLSRLAQAALPYSEKHRVSPN